MIGLITIAITPVWPNVFYSKGPQKKESLFLGGLLDMKVKGAAHVFSKWYNFKYTADNYMLIISNDHNSLVV